MNGEWLCYGGGQCNPPLKNCHATEVVSLMEGQWSCYREGHFNRGRMVILQRWSLQWRENGHVTELVSVGRENCCYRIGQFNGGSMVMLQR